MAVMDSSEEERRKNENEEKGVTERLLAVDSEGKEKAETKTTMDRMTSGVKPAGKSTIKSLLSIGVIIGVAASWACATQFRKSTMVIDPAHFYAPYAMVWFSTCFMLLCYPVFLIYAFFAGKNLSIEHTEALKVFRAKSPSGFHLFGAFLWRELLFLSLWTVINYAYAQSLGLISASAATSIMSANTAAVCVLGWAILREPFNAIKTLAVLLAIAGVVVVSLDSEFAGSPLGIGLCVASAACAALYKVLFKLFHGSTATLGQVSLFMSGLGLVNLTLNAIPMANLVHFGVDRIEWDHVPWLPLFGSAILGLVFNFLVNFGIVLLDPLIISIGMIFGIPLSAGIDLLFRSLTASPEFLCGSILVTISFFLIAFPVESILRKCCCHRNNLEEENVKLNRAISRKDGN